MPNLDALLNPRSVVVIGASEDDSGIRGHCCKTLLRHRYWGKLTFVSRSTPMVLGRKTVPSIDALEHVPDLAVLLTPAQVTPDILEECAAIGIPAAISVASGFSEEGSLAGRERQARLIDIATRHDIALSGPNGEGFADYVSGLAATFSPVLGLADPIDAHQLTAGDVTIVAQSGAIGFGLADLAQARGLVLDRVITTGNEATLNLTHYLNFLVDEGRMKSLIVYAEGWRDGRGFLAVAARAKSRGIAITVLRAGKSDKGREQVASHTGALAADDKMVADLLAETGVVDASDPIEAVECAGILAGISNRPMAGNRVAICSSTGGGAGLLADACGPVKLSLPPLADHTRKILIDTLPDYATTDNPVDATAGGIRALGYTKLLTAIAEDPSIDAVITAASGRTIATIGREKDALIAFAKACTKPVVFWSYTEPIQPFRDILSEAGTPLALGTHAIAKALAAHAGKTEQNEGLNESSLTTSVPHDCTLIEAQAYPLLEAQGLPVARWRLCQTAQDAHAFLSELGKPAVLKIQSLDITHKTEASGVALNVTAQQAEETFDRLLTNARAYAPDAAIEGVLVQEMAPPGEEIILGGLRDPSFGPVVMVGLGGITAEALGDVTFATAPVSEKTASTLVNRLQGNALLQGFRGRQPADLKALYRAVVGVSHLIATPGIREIDLNPVFVHETGLTVADALIVTGRAGSDKGEHAK